MGRRKNKLARDNLPGGRRKDNPHVTLEAKSIGQEPQVEESSHKKAPEPTAPAVTPKEPDAKPLSNGMPSALRQAFLSQQVTEEFRNRGGSSKS